MEQQVVVDKVKIEVALKDFKTQVLDKNNIKFLIVGSLALDKLGMEIGCPHDIDMEAICTPETEEIFALLSRSQCQTFYLKECYSSDAEKRMDKVTWTHKPYIFKWGDVSINVWVVSMFSHEYVTLSDGINYAKVMSVIRKKVAYQRKKDKGFLVNLAQKFIGMYEVE